VTPIIKKFVLKLLSKDRGSGITSLPGAQHRMIQESIITDTLLKRGVNPETITSEGMLQSILNGIKKEEAMIARSKAEAQKNLATVMDMKGRKIRPGAKIMGGEEVIETEAEIAKRLNKGNKEGIERIKEKQLIESFDPDEMASGGRAGFAAGGMGRRAFLKLMAALGATGVAAKSGLVSLLGKGGGKQVAKELTQVPIKQTADMPAWFKPLVNKVIKEGEDVTKQWAYKDRQVVHTTKLPDSQTDVLVTQDLDSGDVLVDIGLEKHGFPDGHLGQPVRLEYKASEVIEPIKGKKGTKTKEEFNVEEAEFTGGHPENVKFEESVIEKFGEHGSNFDEVEMFATGKIKKSKPTKKAQQLEWEQGKAEADAEAAADMADDFADGGRVPMWMGGGLGKGKGLLRKIMRHHAETGTTGLTGSEMLKLVNPKQFNKMLDNPEGIPSIAREMIEKYTKEMKADRVGAVEHSLGLAKKMKKAKDKSKEMDKITEALTKDFVDKGMDKEMVEGLIEMFLKAKYPDYQKVKTIKALPNVTDEAILELENIQKNLATKDRKLNASGGLAGMLGE